MAKSQLLKLTGPTTAITFTIEGGLRIRYVPVYKPAATDPRPLESIREEWSITGCKVEAADASTLWAVASGTNLNAFIAALKTRGTGAITGATLYRDGTGTNSVASLSTGFQVDEVVSDIDQDVPLETWQTRASFDIKISSYQPKASSAGIVTFRQRVHDFTDEDGLRVLEWITELTTDEGISAVTKLGTYGKIPAATASAYFSWETNSTTGVDVLYTDADESTGASARTPTVARGISRIKQWGMPIGSSSAGTSPTRIDYSQSTETRAEGGSVVAITTTKAEAFGPGAKNWVLQQRPISNVSGQVLEDVTARQGYRGTWVVKGTSTSSVALVSIAISGGGQAGSFEPAATGVQPIQFVGCWMPWTATVVVSTRRLGSRPSRSQMPLPARLPPPWVLRQPLTTEEGPSRVEVGASRSQDLWERRATCVYECGGDPGDTDWSAAILDGGEVETYKLGGAANGS